jgi:hypothetical protein
MHWTTRSVTFSFLAVVLLGLVVWAAMPPRLVYLRNSEAIESYLEQQTPLGTPAADVADWLEDEGAVAELIRRLIVPGSDMPPSRGGGSGYVHSLLATYRSPLHVSVEAFYILDSQERLVEIRVRKIADGP